MDFENLWVIKYRPDNLKDILLPSNVREFFENIEKNPTKTIPHIMLYGPPGGGKTSLGKIIINSLLKCENLYINASDQNGIETVRGIIMNFVQTKSFDGLMKVILLDEFDGFSSHSGGGSSAQQSLRNIMEEYATTTRFILTCNYPQKVIDPIKSRVQSFFIQPELKQFTQRCIEILKSEKIIFTADSKTAFFEIINGTYPDLRLCLNELQKHSVTGTFKQTIALDKEVEKIASICWQMIIEKQDDNLIRKYIIENEKFFKNDYQVLLKALFEVIYKNDMDNKKKRQLLLTIAEGMYLNTQVFDKEINFFALTLKLSGIL